MTGTRTEAEWAAWLLELLDQHRDQVVEMWSAAQKHSVALGSGGSSRDLRVDTGELVDALLAGLRLGGSTDVSRPEFEPLRRLLADASLRGARSGATPSETATSVLSLKEGVLGVLNEARDVPPDQVLSASIVVFRLVDGLALHTFDTYVQGREEVISRQSDQLLELSTPVVKLWDGVVGVPLVGALDSARAQVVMESLLQAIVDEQASVAILDITGVPTVDTLVAQHLLKTVTATRLMGADCIISGIRPQTAQTIVQLGIDLADITTRATLQAALMTAIERVGASGPPATGR